VYSWSWKSSNNVEQHKFFTFVYAAAGSIGPTCSKGPTNSSRTSPKTIGPCRMLVFPPVKKVNQNKFVVSKPELLENVLHTNSTKWKELKRQMLCTLSVTTKMQLVFPAYLRNKVSNSHNRLFIGTVRISCNLVKNRFFIGNLNLNNLFII